MPELFTNEWINKLKDAWNQEPEVSGALAKINFDSMIGAGFQNEDQARVYFKVEKGMSVEAGVYTGQKLDWDMRATKETWEEWQKEGIGIAGLGLAYTTGKLKFKTGDYGAMIKNPSMAGPFGKCFNLMQKIK